MARFIGAILGAAHIANSGAVGSYIDPYFCNGRVARILSDFWTGDAAQNDIISLGYVDWTTRFDALSTIDFDDLGTSVTMDVGVANDPDCLIDGQDVATAAGSVALLKSVALANRRKALWELAGYASLQAARDATRADGSKAELIATLLGANPVSGGIGWSIYGSPQ
jgi:hypothetical protein